MIKSRYSILIICEGKNTEPYFFNSIRDEVLNKKYDIGDCTIRIRPESKNGQINLLKSVNKPDLKSRTTKKATVGNEPEEIKGVPPLKWVEAGKDELRNGTFNEVWAVFDHDNHPTRKEAFESAKEDIHGLKVNIAFSSRSFEYYLLLHFERTYNKFNVTDCNTGGKNPKSLVCSTGKHQNDCNGKTCINGYARLNGYWDNSKEGKSIYPIIKDKLELGFINSEWLRLESEKKQSGSQIYDRNPYITVDCLVKRLTGNKFSWIWLLKNTFIKVNNLQITSSNSNELILRNSSNSLFIIPPNSFVKYQSNHKQEAFGEKIILQPIDLNDPQNQSIVNLDTNAVNDILFYVFTYEKYKVIIEA